MTPAKNSTKSRIIRGVAVGWMAHACGIVVTFVTTPIVIGQLGDVRYGFWSIVMTLTGYYGLANLGLGKAAAKYIAQYDGLGDAEMIRRILATTLRAYILLAGVVVALAAVLAWCFPLLYGDPGLEAGTIAVVVLLIGLRVAFQLPGSTFRSALIAYKRFDLTNVLAIVSQVSTGVTIVTIVLLGGGLAEMAMAVFVVGTLLEVATWLVAKWALDLPRFRLGDADSATQKMMLGFGILTVVTNSAQQFAKNSGPIIGGIIAGPAAVAYYSVAQTMTQKCLMLSKPIGQAVLPAASQLQAQKRDDKLNELIEQSYRVLLGFAFALATTICVFGYHFIGHWISFEFADRTHVMFCLLAVSLIASFPGTSTLQMLQGLGEVRLAARLSVAEAVVVVCAAIPMTIQYGMIGMAIVVATSTIVFRGVLQSLCLFRVTGFGATRFIRQVVLPALLAFVPTFMLAVLVRTYAAPGNLIWTLLEMASVMAVSAVAVFLFCLDSQVKREAVTALLGSKIGKLSTRH